MNVYLVKSRLGNTYYETLIAAETPEEARTKIHHTHNEVVVVEVPNLLEACKRLVSICNRESTNWDAMDNNSNWDAVIYAEEAIRLAQ